VQDLTAHASCSLSSTLNLSFPNITAPGSTFPTHRFVLTERGKSETVLKRFKVRKYPANVYYYDPYFVEGDPNRTEKNLAVLNEEERGKYDGWRKTILFNEQYKARTGRSYLANYLRDPPVHFMWPADYFGQEHWVLTRETQFVQMPPAGDLQDQDGQIRRRLKDNEPRLLHEYREANQDTMNMTLRVLSCAPRVYEIPDFLSPVEVAHVLELASGVTLKQSRVGDNDEGQTSVDDYDDLGTRTSYNSWVARDKSPVVDAIYRRAADLMRIDEAAFRKRGEDELPELPTRSTLAESLQLVHYAVGQEYTEHHDFGYTRIDNKLQGERFATLLLYLNAVPKGGETSFPRWSNAETFKPLNVAADEAGKAVLFYSQLPDGNFDDFSQHAALPVVEGEKVSTCLLLNLPDRFLVGCSSYVSD